MQFSVEALPRTLKFTYPVRFPSAPAAASIHHTSVTSTPPLQKWDSLFSTPHPILYSIILVLFYYYILPFLLASFVCKSASLMSLSDHHIKQKNALHYRPAFIHEELLLLHKKPTGVESGCLWERWCWLVDEKDSTPNQE